MRVGRLTAEPSVTGRPSSASGSQSLPRLSASRRSPIWPPSLVAAAKARSTAASAASSRRGMTVLSSMTTVMRLSWPSRLRLAGPTRWPADGWRGAGTNPAFTGRIVSDERRYVVANSTGDGARWLDIAPERLAGWLESFGKQHGGAVPGAAPAGDAAGMSVVEFRAADGAVAECHVPFPPLPSGHGETGAAQIAAHASADRTVAVLLVRLGGYAAGVFT